MSSGRDGGDGAANLRRDLNYVALHVGVVGRPRSGDPGTSVAPRPGLISATRVTTVSASRRLEVAGATGVRGSGAFGGGWRKSVAWKPMQGSWSLSAGPSGAWCAVFKPAARARMSWAWRSGARATGRPRRGVVPALRFRRPAHCSEVPSPASVAAGRCRRRLGYWLVPGLLWRVERSERLQRAQRIGSIAHGVDDGAVVAGYGSVRVRQSCRAGWYAGVHHQTVAGRSARPTPIVSAPVVSSRQPRVKRMPETKLG